MAVYTHLDHATIAAFLAGHYHAGTLDRAHGIAQGVENSNYRLDVWDAHGTAQRYILTLYEKRMDVRDLPFFLGLMQHLAQRGVQCPQPIVRRDGALFGPLAARPAALVSFLTGQSVTTMRTEHCAQAGAALSMLHRAGADFSTTRGNTLSLGGWVALQEKIATRLNIIQPGLADMVASELAFLHAHWPQPQALPCGVIHADFFPDNVFFDDQGALSGIIDFYFACEDFLAYDLAIAINAWCFDGAVFNRAKATAMLMQYQQHRRLTDAEKKAFLVLLRGAALRFLLTRAHDLLHHDNTALVTPHDPLEYVAKLAFHQQADDMFFTARAMTE